jgi:sec-independent protein translocase protein TatA
MLNFLNNIGPTEIIVIAIIILVLFGGKKLPEMGKGLGEALGEIKKAFGQKEEKKKS